MTTVDLSDARPVRTWWRPVTAWTAAVLIYATVLAVQVHLPFAMALRQSAVYLYSLALLLIPVRRWSSRSLAGTRPSVTLLLKHVAVGLVTIAAWLGLTMLHDRFSVGPNFWQLIYADSWMFQLMFAVVVYGAALGLMLASQAWARERDRERRESDLTLTAREAELTAIRAQFQPHFVLNALNSLLALIDQDPALARTMVVRLADVMKAVFDRVDLPAVPLERELDLIRAYLDVERIRFGPRLSVTFEIDDAARGVMVPPFLLQPIVENAVKHGIAPHARPGEVRISATVARGRMQLAVRDSGTGSSPTLGTGRGLPLTRRRLDSVYGDGYELTMDHRADGTAVRIDVPIEHEHVA